MLELTREFLKEKLLNFFFFFPRFLNSTVYVEKMEKWMGECIRGVQYFNQPAKNL